MAENSANTPKLRNARACEACRASKSKCIYKSQLGVCQRCEASGAQCIVRAKARPMRTRTARPGSSSTSQIPISAHSEFSLNLPTVSQPDARKELVALHDHHKDFFGDEIPEALKDRQSSEDSHRTSPSRQSLIEQRKVTLLDAEKLLSSYRHRASSFPFVYIPPSETVPSLARTSPFLLLAILTSASIEDLPLYHQMNHEFRRVLSSKVIVEGKKSLDYLQGLLVYCAWYPHHVNPKNNQSFMYMNLCISLIADLGLDQEKPITVNFNEIDTRRLTEGDDFSKAAKRAYLGCYYLSCSLSQGFQKPNNLQYQSLMDVHGEVLMLDEHSPEIYSLVKLQRIAEKIMMWHSSKQPAGDSQMDALNAEVNIQIFLNELNEWRHSTNDVIRNLINIGIAERFAEITVYSYQLGFLRRPYREHLVSTAFAEPANPSHLNACLTACKTFFEYILSLPESSYLDFTVVAWAQVVQAIVVISRLTFLMAANMGWDANATRANIPFTMYLDALSYRFQHLSSTPSEGTDPPKNPDVLYVFKMMLGSVKKSYERRLNKIQPEFFVDNAMGVARGHCPVLDPGLSIYFSTPDSTYGSSFDTGNSTPSFSAICTPLYHDLWATMTGSWAAE
ncbi:uncharacterized protein LY89DRAFT_731670 [Mollisia scopiformis]|uniref:Zn(2)-C6 fungal-type domain-containing protein n=1 Tax=Mollisia scopiformis TaxID=149040 RepID=A0A194XHK9_MOLSC|nr:uncharacterized protein LY89DRAFT_731670 [Mollisia scopiformis]KUJ19262.1 hypothetical protein LY89DRAFT_731670 [Mollisia scopiformis]